MGRARWGGLQYQKQKSPEYQQEVVLISQIPVFFSVLYTLI